MTRRVRHPKDDGVTPQTTLPDFPFSLSEQSFKSDLYANELDEKDRCGPILTRETFAVLVVAASNVTVECQHRRMSPEGEAFRNARDYSNRSRIFNP